MNDKIYPSNFYGDSTRWFIGVIEDINDPLRLGRVRVRIRGVHTPQQDEIQTGDLPWAQTVIPTTEGGVSGIGRSSNLQPGAEVFGFFLDGKASQIPLVVGSIPKIEYSTSTQVQSESYDERTRRSDMASSTSPGTGTTGVRNGLEASTSQALGGTGSTNSEIAYNFFVAYGFTSQQSAGVVGNLMKESGPALDTSVKAAGSEQSFGIAQWNAGAGRYQQLLEFANDLGRDWTDIDVQLRFIVWELENFPYLGLSHLRAARTIEQAVIAFEEKYERPSVPDRPSRIAYARDIHTRMVAA